MLGIDIFLVGLISIISTLTVVNIPKKDCFKMEKIIQVGQCDYEGKCKVLLGNGEYKKELLPIKGQGVCIAEKLTY